MKNFINIFNFLSIFVLMIISVPAKASEDSKGLIVSFNGPVKEAYIGKYEIGRAHV